MARRRMPDVAAALTVREALAVKLRRHKPEAADPRCVLDPSMSARAYVDPLVRILDLLEAGEPVDVWPHLMRGLAEVPAGCGLARIEVDGTVIAAPHERLSERVSPVGGS